MATKSGQPEPEKAEVIEELLDALDTALDRVKVLYEQYFLGIQKQPPTYLHTDIERKIRDITQIQVRNTAMRYRFATIQQKFGSYNAYWRRTLRQIENGTYTRNLVKISRQAARTGADIPDEILAAMPKRMRDQVKRDREAALAVARLREHQAAEAAPAMPPGDDDLLTLADESGATDLGAAVIHEPAAVRRDVRAANGALEIDESDGDFDLDAFFAKVVNEAAPDPTPEQAPVKWGASDRPVRSAPTGLARPIVPPAERPAMPGMRPSMATTQAIPMPRRGDGEESVTRPMPRPEGLPVHDDGPPAARFHAGAPRKAETGVIPATIPAIGPAAIPPIRPVMPVAPRLGTQPAAIIPPSVAAAAATRPGMIAPAPAAGPSGTTPSSGVPTAVMPPLPGPSRPVPPPPRGSTLAPSQAARPSPIAPGASSRMPALAVETLAGPFPRIPAPGPEDDPHTRPTVAAAPLQRPGTTPGAGPANPVAPALPIVPQSAVTPARGVAAGRLGPKGAQTMAPLTSPVSEPPSTPMAAARPPAPPPRPAAPRPPVPGVRPPAPAPAPAPPKPTLPAGVSDADVNALYSKYVQAKQTLGEQAGPNAYDKLLKTIHAQAPKIMEQYKAKGVDFSVVVKDNQVVIRAKPKP